MSKWNISFVLLYACNIINSLIVIISQVHANILERSCTCTWVNMSKYIFDKIAVIKFLQRTETSWYPGNLSLWCERLIITNAVPHLIYVYNDAFRIWWETTRRPITTITRTPKSSKIAFKYVMMRVLMMIVCYDW